MTETTGPAEVPYPAAPWHLFGKVWVGIFKTKVDAPLPAGLRPFLDPRWRVAMLVRYLGGTRRYDEFVLGRMARRGLRPGLFVEGMWVPDLVSLWGGRRIWGLPKEMATFAWEGDMVRITDDAGLVARLTVDQRGPALPPLWLPLPGVGHLDGQWAYTLIRFRGRLSRARLRVHEWSERFPAGLGEQPMMALAAENFRITVPAPTLLQE